ncbi:MAG: hypothetical protein Kow0037_11280 [Calditrichia bacterium]
MTMVREGTSYEELQKAYQKLELENKRLLDELEASYSQMHVILMENRREKEITYQELEKRLEDMERLYNELSEKENMLVHLEKLSSIGQFITELIHELSSPLTAITLQAQITALQAPNSQVQKQLEVIKENAERMATLLNRFKAMAYKGQESFEEISLNAVIEETTNTLEVLKPKKIGLQLELPEGNLPILGDKYQIQQILLNLAKNSFDAMRDTGGELKIKLSRINLSTVKLLFEKPLYFERSPEEWLKTQRKCRFFALLTVKDNGCGIPENVLKNIFEPFFTTKERGKGTGLGMAITSEIMQRHNGLIAVASVPNKGTTFFCLFPVLKA